MSLLSKGIRIISAVALASALTAAAVVPAVSAGEAEAATSAEMKEKQKDLKDELAEAQNELDAASDAYTSVLAEQETAEKLAKEAADKIAAQEEAEAKVQEKLSSRITDMYKNNETALFLDLVLGADTLADMIANWNMLSALNSSDASMISQSKNIRSEIAMLRLEAEEAEMLARSKAEEAEMIRDNAQAKSDDLEKKIKKLDKDIKEKVLEEAALAAASGTSADPSAKSGAARSIPTNGDVVDYAYSRLGCPYVWGAAGPNTFDCSGLVMWCYGKTGKSLPHNSEALHRSAKAVIPVSEAEPGDVLWRPGHVGIYIGGGKYIHAPHSGDVVKIASGSRWSAALRF